MKLRSQRVSPQDFVYDMPVARESGSALDAAGSALASVLGAWGLKEQAKQEETAKAEAEAKKAFELAEKRRRVTAELQAAIQTGDKAKVAELSMQNPELKKEIADYFQFTNEQSKEASLRAYRRALADPENAEQHLADGVEEVRRAGGSPANMMQDIENLRRAPEEALDAMGFAVAQLDPEGYKAFEQVRKSRMDSQLGEEAMKLEQDKFKFQQQQAMRDEKAATLSQEIAMLKQQRDMAKDAAQLKKINLEIEKREKEQEQMDAQKRKEDRAAVRRMTDTRALVKEILSDPDTLKHTVGKWDSLVPDFLARQRKVDMRRKIEQLKGKNFLQGVNEFVGKGALSDNEGRMILQSVSALDDSMSYEAFVDALKKIDAALGRALDEYSGNQNTADIIGQEPGYESLVRRGTTVSFDELAK